MAGEIKIYRNTDAGAPPLTGQAGSLIAVLDAVLVNGYNVVSVTGITRVASTATVQTATDHKLRTGEYATVAGAAQTEYNGEFPITVTGARSFTFAVSGSPATPATGTLTAKRAPGGFTKTFAKTNVATYRSIDPSSNRNTLRVQDDGGGPGGPLEAVIGAFEVMLDVDTGEGPNPGHAANNAGYYWRKSETTNATARPWAVITNGKMLYIFFEPAGVNTNDVGRASNYTQQGAFGDIISYRAGDIYCCVLDGNAATGGSYPTDGMFVGRTTPGEVGGGYSIARNWTGGGPPLYCGSMGFGTATIGGANVIDYPHPVDNGLYVVPVAVTQSRIFRGRLPGVFEPLHYRPFPTFTRIKDVVGLPGRELMMMHIYNTSTPGGVFFDVTGPWDS